MRHNQEETNHNVQPSRGEHVYGNGPNNRSSDQTRFPNAQPELSESDNEPPPHMAKKTTMPLRAHAAPLPPIEPPLKESNHFKLIPNNRVTLLAGAFAALCAFGLNLGIGPTLFFGLAGSWLTHYTQQYRVQKKIKSMKHILNKTILPEDMQVFQTGIRAADSLVAQIQSCFKPGLYKKQLLTAYYAGLGAKQVHNEYLMTFMGCAPKMK